MKHFAMHSNSCKVDNYTIGDDAEQRSSIATQFYVAIVFLIVIISIHKADMFTTNP